MEDDAFIDFLPGRIEKAGQGSKPWFWDKPNQLIGNRPEISARKTHDADATAAVRSGNGSDQVSWPYSCHPRSCAKFATVAQPTGRC